MPPHFAWPLMSPLNRPCDITKKFHHGFKITNFINSNTVKITIINSMSKSLTFNMAEKSYELRKIHVLFGKPRSFKVYCVQLK